MYYAKHTQSTDVTWHFRTVAEALEQAEDLGWEDSETMLMEISWPTPFQHVRLRAEFPCTYTFRYGTEAHTCELTANRPDSLCPFHAGEED